MWGLFFVNLLGNTNLVKQQLLQVKFQNNIENLVVNSIFINKCLTQWTKRFCLLGSKSYAKCQKKMSCILKC